ncbi:MAG: ABC transporter ATP-binding protein/permease [Bacteroidales bacterium]|nr:ABC transporter ATP-binding protein/permease [Bacteroidales bacterium]MCM1414552.1 ABC transporter ATP-binding protein/permease [bacterium]MCM1422602.1 ABC transporter ATP-binding protein/permease [bacterium]
MTGFDGKEKIKKISMEKTGIRGVLYKLGYIFDKRDKRNVMLLLLAVIAGSFLELSAVAVFSPFADILINPDAIQKTWYLKRLYDAFACRDYKEFLTILSVIIIVIYVVKNVYLICERSYIFKFSYDTQKNLSTRLLTTYMKEPYTFYLDKNIATLQRSLQEDTSQFMQVIMYSLELITEIVTCFVLGVFLLIESKSITIVILSLLCLCVGLFFFITKKYARGLGQQNQRYRGMIFQWMNQSLGGIKEIRILGRESYFVDEYRKYYSKYSRGLRISRVISILPKYIVEAVCMTGLLLAIIIKLRFGGADVIYYLPQLATFAVAALRLMPSVGKINEYTTSILYALPSVDLICHDLEEIAAYVEQQDAEVKEAWNLEKEIRVEHVTFTYPNVEEPVIRDADLVIQKGSAVAFVGTTGAGKTTMVDIILGLLEPQEGKVMADGLNVRERPRTFHTQVGYIPQVIYLSDDTIRNNIAFGVKESEIDEAAVERAADMAQLTGFIESLPRGLDTIVGDRGVRLSGGQRQRIGIARALYHDPEILVLDEATSALDSDTESAVMEAVENLQGTKTMLIIAHRLTTIRNVDRIYEVGNGKVVEKSKEEVFGERPVSGSGNS